MNELTKTTLIVLLAAAACGVSATSAQGSTPYSSLQDFCLKTNADTAENCQCGQETADALLTPEEQTMALNMMGQAESPVFDSSEAQDAFMAKLAQVTAGCQRGDSNGLSH